MHILSLFSHKILKIIPGNFIFIAFYLPLVKCASNFYQNSAPKQMFQHFCNLILFRVMNRYGKSHGERKKNWKLNILLEASLWWNWMKCMTHCPLWRDKLEKNSLMCLIQFQKHFLMQTAHHINLIIYSNTLSHRKS